MHPYDHARSSARLHGGLWQDYHAFHAWFDVTKAVQFHFTHRALRHHREGIDEAVATFGSSIWNRDGAPVDTSVLGLQHLKEDCRMIPAAGDWLVDFDAPDWLPVTWADTSELACESARRFGGGAERFSPLHDWFLETKAWTAGPQHLLFRHHAFGIFEAEARFGAVVHGPSGPGVPTRVVAEWHVRQVLGRIPAATDFLRRIKGQRWMLQATSPRKLGLD